MDGGFNIATDQPIRRKEDDILGRGDFVERLAKALVAKKGDTVQARNTVVGLTGPWASIADKLGVDNGKEK